jgi:hypothetical protein
MAQPEEWNREALPVTRTKVSQLGMLRGLRGLRGMGN